MDYVVYGTGYGATLMLLGYAIRTWGPGWRFRDGEEAAYDRREFRSARSSWRRFTTGLGAAIATGGAVLVLLTFVLMLVNPGDGIGSTVALSVSGVLLAGVAVWAWLFFDRFGAWGIVATPDALSSYEPAQYDSRAAATAPEAVEAEDADEGEDETPYEEEEAADDEELEVDTDADDEAEFAVRSSKFELHHPEGEEPAGDDAAPVVADEDRFEAQYSKFESHHPEGETAPETEAGAEIEEIEEYVETLTPEEVSEDIVDNADEEPVSDEADAPVESYEDLVGDDASEDPVEDVIAEDPLEVLPEAHEDVAPEPAVTDDASREAAGSREDALRRLRERQAARARERDADDV